VVSTTGGDGQVALSWTASSAQLGFNISGYEVGRASTAGGTYTYTDVGFVLSSVSSGLDNGTTYYFVVRALDNLTNAIATSTEVTGLPAAAAVVAAASALPSGGGGGIFISTPITKISFSGWAYPLSNVTLLKDGQVAITTIAGPDAKFDISLSNLTAGNYTFALYSDDNDGNRSSLFTFSVVMTKGAQTTVGGIIIVPTIGVDKSEVKQGDNVAIFGQSTPNSDITISVNSEHPYFVRTTSNNDGVYLHNFDTSPLEFGQHFTKAKTDFGGQISSFSNTIGFLVGNENIIKAKTIKKVIRADFNGDGRVNLLDFSIVAFWHKRTLSSDFNVKEKIHLNGDSKVDLVDFSIMAFYWTG